MEGQGVPLSAASHPGSDAVTEVPEHPNWAFEVLLWSKLVDAISLLQLFWGFWGIFFLFFVLVTSVGSERGRINAYKYCTVIFINRFKLTGFHYKQCYDA